MCNYRVKIVVAVHKPYQMPSDPMYMPLHVGAEGKDDIDSGYQKDNVGDNISHLNPFYCELTGLYWAWKNIDAEYIGLTHYRRHFSMTGRKGFDNILKYKELQPFLGKIKVFTPNKRKYFIETLYSHYKHTHYASQLDETRKIILAKYPDYIESYDLVVKRSYGYMFNMMIMEKELLDEYCMWLFDILSELKTKVNIKELSAFQQRFYGRISEIIFNVWLEKQMKDQKLKRTELMEIPYIHMEKINWIKKGKSFLKAKFFNKKYEGSF